MIKRGIRETRSSVKSSIASKIFGQITLQPLSFRVPSVGTEAQKVRKTKETIERKNKTPKRTLLFGYFVSFVMTVPAERPPFRKASNSPRMTEQIHSPLRMHF